MTNCSVLFLQVLTAIGNFCICSIAVGMILEIIVMYPIQQRSYRTGINNLLVLLIGGIPIAMPTVLSVTLAIGSHRLSQQVQLWSVLNIQSIYFLLDDPLGILGKESHTYSSRSFIATLLIYSNVSFLFNYLTSSGSHYEEDDGNWRNGWNGCAMQW